MTCLSCGIEIPAARRAAMPLAEFCVECQPEPPPIRPEQIPDAMAEPGEIELGEAWGI